MGAYLFVGKDLGVKVAQLVHDLFIRLKQCKAFSVQCQASEFYPCHRTYLLCSCVFLGLGSITLHTVRVEGSRPGRSVRWNLLPPSTHHPYIDGRGVVALFLLDMLLGRCLCLVLCCRLGFGHPVISQQRQREALVMDDPQSAPPSCSSLAAAISAALSIDGGNGAMVWRLTALRSSKKPVQKVVYSRNGWSLVYPFLRWSTVLLPSGVW